MENDFSCSICVQTGCVAHPASCTMGTWGSFPEGKARPGRDADHSFHLVPKSRTSESYTPLPPNAFMACRGTALGLAKCCDDQIKDDEMDRACSMVGQPEMPTKYWV
jgi:hypothetical protein